MGFSIAFNLDNGAGQVDPMRVSRVGWLQTPDPLDGNLVFSALYPNAMAEEFVLASPANPNGWNARVATNRAYSVPPLVMPIFINDDGLRFYPGYYNDYASVSGALVPVYWSIISYCKAIDGGGGTYYIGANITTTGTNGYWIRKGTLRLYVIGVG